MNMMTMTPAWKGKPKKKAMNPHWSDDAMKIIMPLLYGKYNPDRHYIFDSVNYDCDFDSKGKEIIGSGVTTYHGKGVSYGWNDPPSDSDYAFGLALMKDWNSKRAGLAKIHGD